MIFDRLGLVGLVLILEGAPLTVGVAPFNISPDFWMWAGALFVAIGITVIAASAVMVSVKLLFLEDVKDESAN